MGLSKDLKVLRVKYGQNMRTTMKQIMIIKRLKKNAIETGKESESNK